MWKCCKGIANPDNMQQFNTKTQHFNTILTNYVKIVNKC